MSEPFYFYTRFHQIMLLGLKAKNPVEMLDCMNKVPNSSIYYHTHRFLQQHHYLLPEPPNDFAYWTSNILNLRELGEALASIDIVSFNSIEELRNKFIDILSKYINAKKQITDSPYDHEFQFMSCKTFIIPLPYSANNLSEFLEIMGKVSISSIYFHMFESPMRLEMQDNDFSLWMKDEGHEELAKRVSNLDPYTMTLESLRKKIIELAVKYGKY